MEESRGSSLYYHQRKKIPCMLIWEIQLPFLATKLVRSLIILFSSFAYLDTVYGKNGNNDTELFRVPCLDITGICSWIIVAKVLIWVSLKYSFFSIILLVTYSSWCFHISLMLSTFSYCSFVLRLYMKIKVSTVSPGTTTWFLPLTFVDFCIPSL